MAMPQLGKVKMTTNPMPNEIAQRLAQIRERADKATPGPWEAAETEGMDCVWQDIYATSTDDEILSAETRPRPHIVHPDYQAVEMHGRQQALANLEFVAQARTDVPWLLDQVGILNFTLVADTERNAGLAKQLELARKDSERLDWIFQNPDAEIVLWGVDRSGINAKKNELTNRAAIDAEKAK